MGDIEQLPPDFLKGLDYSYLVAMMAPRPTLLTYNAEDDCCFRAGLVKPGVYDDVRPFFKLYGKEDVFTWHENRDPGTHNYQLDNRLADYRFFSKQFGLPLIDNEDGAASEIKSYEELQVGLPKDNLSIVGLARKLAGEITRDPIPSDPSAKAAWSSARRTKLKDVVRYKPVDIRQAWAVATTKRRDVQSLSYLFEASNQLSASGVWLRSIAQSSDTAPVTIVLNDDGRETTTDVVSDRLARGEQVLALDLIFTGNSWKDQAFEFAQMLDVVGDRTIGIEAAQLIGVARWAEKHSGAAKVRLETGGMRTQRLRDRCGSGARIIFRNLSTDGLHSSVTVSNLRVELSKQAPELSSDL